MAVLADEANVSQEGKLNVMGIFDRISAADFPVVHPKMVFAFRVESAPGDGGRTFAVRVLLESPEGEVMFEATGEIVPPRVPAGELTTANQVFALVGVQFPTPGMYRFIVSVGDEEMHETPFLVQSAIADPKMN